MKKEFLLGLSLLLLFANTLSAKDLSRRLGIGFAQAQGDVVSTPAISIRFHQNKIVSYSGQVAFNTRQNALLLGGKFFRNLLAEDYLNFFMSSGVFLLNKQDASSGSNVSKTGFHFEAMVGAEFFLPHLDNLSFMIETGLGLTLFGSEVTFRTMGTSFVTAGIHYYL